MVDYTESPFEQIVSFSFPTGFFILFGSFIASLRDPPPTGISIIGQNPQHEVDFVDPPLPTSLPVIGARFPADPENEALTDLMPHSLFDVKKGTRVTTLVIPFLITGNEGAGPATQMVSGAITSYVFFGKPTGISPNGLVNRANKKLVGLGAVTFGGVVGGSHHLSQTIAPAIATCTIIFAKRSATCIWSG